MKLTILTLTIALLALCFAGTAARAQCPGGQCYAPSYGAAQPRYVQQYAPSYGAAPMKQWAGAAGRTEAPAERRSHIPQPR
jgi:ABC-type sugar transport system substrate-binding protein